MGIKAEDRKKRDEGGEGRRESVSGMSFNSEQEVGQNKERRGRQGKVRKRRMVSGQGAGEQKWK